MQPFARTIHEIPKDVAPTTLKNVDWNAELLGGDLREAAHELKGRPGGPLHLGGSTFATDVVGWGLVDEYGFTVHPWVAGLPLLLDLTPIAATTSPPAPSRRRTGHAPDSRVPGRGSLLLREEMRVRNQLQIALIGSRVYSTDDVEPV